MLIKLLDDDAGYQFVLDSRSSGVCKNCLKDALATWISSALDALLALPVDVLPKRGANPSFSLVEHLLLRGYDPCSLGQKCLKFRHAGRGPDLSHSSRYRPTSDNPQMCTDQIPLMRLCSSLESRVSKSARANTHPLSQSKKPLPASAADQFPVER